ncbi:pilus assembly protein CpaF [Loktanella salsilacus]|jgi:pilus assembly protein CpaF|uniref:Pilus assembly protein CpaF n=1 Tax=Loktanella salsilacus TaxID=195913 RepID=A0A1I4CHW9_9RHOB|nr:CpaF family protein [Loktanella salsilacus]UTH49581.1 CpaF family protein [Loktanella salsilacus]SFK80842.1 pilus assembly protein CpaF [Loktanella salsilacus]
MFTDYLNRRKTAPTNVVQLMPATAVQEAAPHHEIDLELQNWLELKSSLHEAMLNRLNLSVIDKMDPVEFKRQIAGLVSQLLLDQERTLGPDRVKQLIEELIFEVTGLGPLEPLLADPTINDILVNNHQKVYVERFGKLEKTQVRFRDERHLLRIIDKIVSSMGRRVDESQPWVDARLPDGSRVNAIIRPCAVDGPSLSIRKFSAKPYSLDRLVEAKALTHPAAAILRGLVEARLNVLISGGTGSGKTTMLNAMSAFIDKDQRIVTIEDAAELQLQQDHVVRLETRPSSIEGTGAITQRELVRNALRMRPDRIIVGEVRGAECFDMLQAMNTGHDGSMTTVHANTVRDALSRLEQMVTMMGADIPMATIRSQIASSIDIIVQLSRHSDGKRRVMSIAEVNGMEGDVITMQEIFTFRQLGKGEGGEVLGELVYTGIRPQFMEKLTATGVKLPPDVFNFDGVTG